MMVMTSPGCATWAAAEIVLRGFDAQPLFESSPLTETWNSLAKARCGVKASTRSAIIGFIVWMGGIWFWRLSGLLKRRGCRRTGLRARSLRPYGVRTRRVY